MFFWIVYTIVVLLVGILFGSLIERHFAARAAEEELSEESTGTPKGYIPPKQSSDSPF